MLNNKDSGGDAFPSSGVVINYDNNEYQQGAYGGMSLRDYFAAKAMQGMTSLFDGGASLEEIEASLSIVTTLSYSIADKMIEARSK